MLRRLAEAWSLVRLRELRLRVARCPFCGPTILLRLCAEDHGLRCVRCAASAIHLAMGWALRDHVADLAARDVCEFSARGPLSQWLRRSARSLSGSEYFPDLASGQSRDGVRCEDMQQLSHADRSFDLLVHTEVLEHVPDDARALRETHRVLREGGLMLFTVPLYDGEITIERARFDDAGHVHHLLPPVYHLDPLRAEGILAFRDYGRDIVQRVHAAGFHAVRILQPDPRIPWVAPRSVIFAQSSR